MARLRLLLHIAALSSMILMSSATNFTSPLCPGSCSLSEIMSSIKHDAQVITNNSQMVQMLEQLITETLDTSKSPQCDLIESYYRRYLLFCATTSESVHICIYCHIDFKHKIRLPLHSKIFAMWCSHTMIYQRMK